MANVIELRGFDGQNFMRYLGDTIKKQDLHRLKNFFATVGPDNQCLLCPSFGEFQWEHDGELFNISYTEEGSPVSSGIGTAIYFQRIKIQHGDIELLQKFVKHALTFQAPIDTQKVKIMFSKSKGYFEQYQDIYAQTLDTIYLDQSLKDSIVHQIDMFFAQKERYVKFGRSYKLNMLFTGVPGSGKTSLVKALALKYKRPLYVFNFSKNLTDEGLISLMADVKDDSIILMEDIDAFFVDRRAQDINVSYSCLINVMDGTMAKANGTIMILTANNPDRLDPALIRPGRIDRIAKFDYPRKQEIQAAFMDITDNPTEEKFNLFYKNIKNIRINMSAIIDFLFRYSSDYLENVEELISQTQLVHEIMNDKSEKMYT